MGPTKTIRGLIVAVVATGLVAPLINLSSVAGAVFGLCSMLGDLVSSFIKRRLDIKSSQSAPGLDRGLEALCPALFSRTHFGLRLMDILVLLLAFFVSEILLSRLQMSRPDASNQLTLLCTLLRQDTHVFRLPKLQQRDRSEESEDVACRFQGADQIFKNKNAQSPRSHR